MPITQNEAFKIPPWIDDTTEVHRLYNAARLWYETKGYSVTTRLLAEYAGDNLLLSDVIPSKPDDNLIRLYVVSIGTQRWLPTYPYADEAADAQRTPGRLTQSRVWATKCRRC